MPTLSPWRKPSPILFLSLTLGLLGRSLELAAAATTARRQFPWFLFRLRIRARHRQIEETSKTMFPR
jgi:hypothetical protein